MHVFGAAGDHASWFGGRFLDVETRETYAIELWLRYPEGGPSGPLGWAVDMPSLEWQELHEYRDTFGVPTDHVKRRGHCLYAPKSFLEEDVYDPDSAALVRAQRYSGLLRETGD